VQQRRNDIGEESVECVSAAHTKARKLVVTDLERSNDPAVRSMSIGQSLNLASAAYSVGDCVEPQGQHHPRAQEPATRASFYRSVSVGEAAKIEPAQQGPQNARRVSRRKHVLGHIEANLNLGSLRLDGAHLAHWCWMPLPRRSVKNFRI
jgi:hypothetical protein